jgi:YD repeat-containing protein
LTFDGVQKARDGGASVHTARHDRTAGEGEYRRGPAQKRRRVAIPEQKPLSRVTLKDVPNTADFEFDIAYGYDLLGRAISVGTAPARPESYSYDALGRMVGETGVFGTLIRDYDSGGRVIKLTHPDGFFVNYDYDAAGNVTIIRENGATTGVGVLATYAYDGLGREAEVTSPKTQPFLMNIGREELFPPRNMWHQTADQCKTAPIAILQALTPRKPTQILTQFS